MKHSIKKQYAVIFIGLMLLVILCCWIVNNTFLETYYSNDKQKALMSVYDKLGAAISDGSIYSEEFDIELQKICGKHNISMLLLDENANTWKATMYDANVLKQQLLDNLFFGGGRLESNEKILEKTDNYVIRSVMNAQTRTEFIEMWGFIGNQNLFLIRVPKEGIHESVAIANRFFAYIVIVAGIVGTLIMWLVSNKVTKPIMELADISDKMKRLDFETKYVGDSQNEIGVLGDNINQLSETLEKTISELKTANNELQRDVERREQIDEMRKEFLSNVSHELKTPIALIQGYAEGLKEGIYENADELNYYCEVIVDEADKMNQMVQKLLTLNQLEFGNDVVTMERFDLAELITDFVQSTDILLKQNGITVKMDVPQNCYVWADEYKVEEVVRNYFSNAVNHCAGEKVIHIKLVQNDFKVQVSVFNTGEPIPMESIPYIWDKFYKVDKARTREYGGSGIGLSIVKAIMESMNEKYGVNNYENGVEFWFELTVNAIED